MLDMNEERYPFYFALASYREAPPTERLRLLCHDLHQPITTFCGISDFFRFSVDQVEPERVVPESVQDLCEELRHLCETLHRLHDEIRDQEASDATIQAALNTAWNHRSLVDQVLKLAERMQGLRDPLEGIVESLDVWIRSLSRAAHYLWVDLDVFANTGQLHIPEEVHAALRLYREIDHAELGSSELLRLMLKAATSPFPALRLKVGVLCRHYPEDKVVETMSVLLHDPSEQVVAWTVDSVRYVKSRKLLPALVENLDRVFDERAYLGWIGEALSHVPDERALEKLIKILDRLMENPAIDTSIYSVAGIRKAIQAIGGTQAEEALKRHFG
jgi:hypothetical protein